MGIHLKAGQWIVQNHEVPGKDAFTFTVNEHDYIDMEWLYQVGCYLLYQVAGYFGISLIHFLLILAVCVITFVRMRGANPPLWSYGFLIFPAMVAVEPRFLARPEVLTWLLLVLTLLILDLRQSRKKDYLFFLPLIQLLWVNTEGIFILGWVVILAYLVGNWIRDKRPDPRLLKFTLFSFGVSLLNPYFWRGVLFPFELYTRMEGSNIFSHFIEEFKSPWIIALQSFSIIQNGTSLMTYRLFSLVLLVLIGLTFKKRKIHELFLTGAFFYLSAAAVRNIPLFFWVVLPIAAAALRDLVSSWSFLRKTGEFLTAKKAPALMVSLLILLMCGRVLTGAYYYPARHSLSLGLDNKFIPLKAVNFMVQNRMEGRLLNDVGFGGWLSWWQPNPIFIDGRLEAMGEDFFSEYIQSFNPGGLSVLADRWNIQLILINQTRDTQWLSQLNSMSDWRLVYFDELSALYVRTTGDSNVVSVNWEDVLREKGIDPANSDANLRDCLGMNPPGPFKMLGDWFAPGNFPMELFTLAGFAYQTGRIGAAQILYLEALKRLSGNSYEIFFDLGETYRILNRNDVARLCFQKALDLNPGLGVARQMLDTL